ncbi:hypothetical protein [Azohydromonas aeria]|uniref:hypothetical protein n=1 Tax=Azohydromonas aeria TaxID=2590212 RepID=UPI0012F98719|nr:hypothetical protein [Azohydromonas aeria]
MPSDPDLMTLVQCLSRYLREHPDACDTPDGIARWWIAAELPAAPVALVEQALDGMQACGAVESSQAADGRVRFRRAGAAAGIEARLDALAADPGPLLEAAARRPGGKRGGMH